MVFSRVKPSAESQFPLGALSYRQGDQYLALLIIEGIYAALVAIANLLVISVLVIYIYIIYIIVANLVASTSLKALVECSFVPYYAIQRNFSLFAPNRVFTEEYELAIFNLSVLADYGTLFFSVLIALNRLSVLVFSDYNFSRKANAAACLTTWLLSMCLPIIFFVFKCKYRYSSENIYYNVCMDFSKPAQLLISVVVYCSYAVVFVVIAIYAGLFWMLRGIKRTLGMTTGISEVQTGILRQSATIFFIYAISIGISLSTEFMDTGPAANVFLVIYLANFSNLAIALVLPMCLLAMSGDIRSILFAMIPFGGDPSAPTTVVPNIAGKAPVEGAFII
ncbi:hypothetical protein PRIPAC_96119 [Pristionchus pacificus]|uniref:Uncharacterized protein n=1 Tax=Pristionchus pacificus TaxID=54126 RepID=A0A2A6B360_PRIPA|nr:hypothetical protein PRIPAC_96119 [Pristionchus pacificus]|eukprot:PDM60317.1 hypothetical protein PRIPAC_54142 [Pristionchus pacificus]